VVHIPSLWYGIQYGGTHYTLPTSDSGVGTVVHIPSFWFRGFGTVVHIPYSGTGLGNVVHISSFGD
jgi:hypothetical protein